MALNKNSNRREFYRKAVLLARKDGGKDGGNDGGIAKADTPQRPPVSSL